jgi:hypothetical protein
MVVTFQDVQLIGNWGGVEFRRKGFRLQFFGKDPFPWIFERPIVIGDLSLKQIKNWKDLRFKKLKCRIEALEQKPLGIIPLKAI